jgi:PleD family two-component response regulator
VLRERPVDVIVLDVMMPDLDGLGVCAVLREDDALRGIPIILLTASSDTETRGAAMALGVSEFVSKPINTRDLLARIRAQLHQLRLTRDLDAILRGPNT